MISEIIETSDGSQTLYVPELNEHYHSVFGAQTESEYIYIEKGYLFSKSKNPTVFEVGFGTGLNALLTALSAEKNKRDTLYITIEKYPLEKTITNQLHYGKNISAVAQNLFLKIHDCKWNKTTRITDFFQLLKIETDLNEFDFSSVTKSDIIYFDAFGPDKQPEMWSPDVFRKIFNATSAEGVFVTYSAKGEVRRNLISAGYTMERLPGPPGKKQILRGIKKESNT